MSDGRLYTDDDTTGPEPVRGKITMAAVEGVHPAGTIDYEPGPDVNLITGPNGCGKTALLDALWRAAAGRWRAGQRGWPPARHGGLTAGRAGGTITVRMAGAGAEFKLRAAHGQDRWEVAAGSAVAEAPAAYMDEMRRIEHALPGRAEPDGAAPPRRVRAADARRRAPDGEHRGKDGAAGDDLAGTVLAAASWTGRPDAGAGGGKPGVIVLIDDAGAGMHPRNQRELIPSLLRLGDAAGADLQIHAATHEPMVCAGAEAPPDAPDGRRREARCHALTADAEGLRTAWTEIKYGSADGWLTSPAFGLALPRSEPAERAILRARELQLLKDPDPADIRAAGRELRRALAVDDPFWPMWTYFEDTEGGGADGS